jgi:hypothetical protein
MIRIVFCVCLILLGSCNNEYIIDYPEIPAGRVILSKENKDSI